MEGKHQFLRENDAAEGLEATLPIVSGSRYTIAYPHDTVAEGVEKTINILSVFLVIFTHVSAL